MKEEINKTIEVLGKLEIRRAKKEISEQTYDNLKNKYDTKVSELKSRAASRESKEAKLKKIRTFIEEKGKYYT